jgi:hypothetical protein
MMNEKSMFKFVSPEGKVVIMVVHSDDCDMVCEDSKAGLYICEQFRQRFGIKMADPAFMLGVNRRKWTDELPSDKPVVLLGVNDQATRWTIHGMVTTGNKTVRMNYHWVQECVRDGIVDPRRVDTVLNTSDIFTKSLGSVDIDRLRPGLTGYGKLPPIPDAPPV